MEKIIKKYKNISYNFFIFIIFAVKIGILYFVSIPLGFWFIGELIRGQFKDGILIFILFVLSITLYFGASEVIKKYNLKFK